MKNVKISLTEFIDFIMKSGPSKMTKVKKVIRMRTLEYETYMDFYKPIRDKIISIHKFGLDKDELKTMLKELKDGKKISNYPKLVDGYIRFLGRKEIGWFRPPSSKLKESELQIAINPELGLEIKDTKYIVKLYFKQESLDKHHADICLTILNRAFNPKEICDAKFAILDVARGKWYTSDTLKKNYAPLVQGEALSFLSMWNNLMKEVA